MHINDKASIDSYDEPTEPLPLPPINYNDPNSPLPPPPLPSNVVDPLIQQSAYVDMQSSPKTSFNEPDYDYVDNEYNEDYVNHEALVHAIRNN